ncbi:molybdopterin molybdotransferase MoeA [Zhihengliuella salsuginis]|uniref:Molybdopterin molybdenumtransferase n=1 Tax=Zhihengliuella salsuginis TaxID=578222 RepID=A0ABQ3GHP4_9MICC|nr:gephyrin-like molybdotransferase Glp [Zhihengliuella salsuginis]GHD07386.1 putative molybdopterin biosynthesis protein MoeA [Zhihengliuella salsuginis]
MSRFRRSVAEHAALVADLMREVPVPTRQAPLADALGRVLAADVAAPIPLPVFDNSQMDGYAVRAADLDGARLAIGRPIAAGAPGGPLAPGTAAPIMTGAPVPDGADTVVPVEAADPDVFPPFVADRTLPHDDGARVALPAPPATRPGQFVRRAGSDVPAGGRALRAGDRITARHAGLAAALGLARLPVIAAPTALLIATGDEVVAPGGDLGPGQIFDANTTLLAASLAEAGWEAATLTVDTDDPEDFAAALRAAVVRHDPAVILTSGGISAGAYEVVKLALGAGGHSVEFGSVAMQPGGPQGAGRLDVGGRTVPLLAFPGNPVSAFVSFEMFLRPVLVERFGARPRPAVTARLAGAADSPAGKLQVRRARYAADGTVELLGGPGSHLLAPLADANALALIDPETTRADPGARLSTILIGEIQ